MKITIIRGKEQQTFTVKKTKGDTYLDVFDKIKEQDPTFTYRKNCRSGICGTCGCTVNGKATLACITLAQNNAVIGPRKGRVIRDLVVDEKKYFDELKTIKPFIIKNEEKDHVMMPSIVDRINHSQDCVLCAVCDDNSKDTPVKPSLIVKAWQYFVDTREAEKHEHITAIHEGLLKLTPRQIKSMETCPLHIPIASKAKELKRLLE
ncbi:succinate dehydrogenase/fumarate reductase iron-sulfur subunit [Candidatus Woesearchaeota archaeon]|nr:MAG: succinate dehydrogenase/fumarate reductase iron-sulfur subunit [Candidatus Woesearchaeota archaeon]